MIKDAIGDTEGSASEGAIWMIELIVLEMGESTQSIDMVFEFRPSAILSTCVDACWPMTACEARTSRDLVM